MRILIAIILIVVCSQSICSADKSGDKMTDACLLQKAVADYNTEDFLNENTAVKQKKQTRLSEDDASDFIFRVVTTTKEGELATLLGDDIDKTDSLVVNGPIDESDFNTMWSGSFYGKLKIINLENATINGEIIPEYAFYHPIEQMGDGCIYVIWLEKIMLPERVTEIGKMAFYSATCLEEVNFPSTLQKLGKGAFGDCVKLKTSPLVLPEGFKDIEGFVFERCRNLDKVVLPSTIKTIGDFAFSETCITSINFPEGLESLGDHAFTFSYLKEVVIPGSCKLNGGNQFSCNRYLEKIIFLDGVVNIPKEFALACGELAKVVVPQSVKTIEYSAFESCIQLKEIDFPERLVSIGDNAFLQTQLNSITLPSTMNELGSRCFPETLKEVVSMASVPPECVFDNSGNGPFDPSVANIIPLYIPVGTKQAYMEATGWNQFYNIIDNVVTGIDGVQAGDGGDVAISAGNGRIALAGTSATTPYHVYDASGREMATGTIGTATEVSCKPGMYIVRAGGTVKKVFVGR